MNILGKFIVSLALVGMGTAVEAAPKGAKKTSKSAAKSSKKKEAPARKAAAAPVRNAFDPNQELTRLTQLYTMGAMQKQAVWEGVEKLARYEKDLAPAKQVAFLQMKAQLLYDADYPVVAATFAVDALKKDPNPLNGSMRPTWHLLWKVSREHAIQYILEDLAKTENLKQNPPYFGNDWNYIIANAFAADGKDTAAMEYYKKIRMGDRYFMPAQYQLAMIHLANKDDQKAEIALKSILYQNTRDASPLPYKDKVEMWNYATMALARLYYQNGQFLKATQHYRKVTHTSPLFYDALFEQSWSLFMNGHPLHSLGTIYDVHSPHFKDVFNPEGKVLEAIVYYWMCRYEDSRNSLADFAESYASIIEGIEGFLDRRQLNPDSAYRLFENLVTGVSSESLGIPRNVLATVAEKDTMLLARDQLATVIEEQDRLDDVGVFGSKKGITVPTRRIDEISRRLKHTLGSLYIAELKAEREHYENLYSQSQFLYIELLMSEKEQLLGGELHSSTKLTKGLANNIRGWSRNTQSWKIGRGEEHWWDEVGYHIVDVEPKCNVK